MRKMDKLWSKLTSPEREAVIARSLEAEPGRYASCLAREFNVRSSSIAAYTRKLAKEGKILAVPQKLAIRGGKVRVKRFYLVGCAPKIDYEHDILEPEASFCGSLWHLLSPDEKRDIILRELDHKSKGISLEGLSRRIGMEIGIVLRWCQRLEEDHYVKISKECRNNELLTIVRATSKKPESASIFRSGSLFQYTKDGWQKVSA
jgi:hypothetical protein